MAVEGYNVTVGGKGHQVLLQQLQETHGCFGSVFGVQEVGVTAVGVFGSALVTVTSFLD
jgi:hypothetical protein